MSVAAVPAALAQAKAPAAPTPTTQPQVDSAYRVNPGDELEVSVWGEERLQRTVHVLPDGTFVFPLVGQVNAAGKLPQEIETIISEQLRSQYRDRVPQVTVSVRTPSGMQFAVMGRVRAPGSFTPGRYVSLLDALSLAGGPAEFAKLDSVMLIRKSGDKVTTMHFKLSRIFKAGASAEDVERANRTLIESGDTIIVP